MYMGTYVTPEARYGFIWSLGEEPASNSTVLCGYFLITNNILKQDTKDPLTSRTA